MKILLDENVPHKLRRALGDRDVVTVDFMGWNGLKNGELLQHAAAGGFEVFVTADQNLTFQQNLTGSALRVIVLVARSNTLEDLLPLVPTLLLAIKDARPGEVRQLGSA